jgi:hypothetical protein
MFLHTHSVEIEFCSKFFTLENDGENLCWVFYDLER